MDSSMDDDDEPTPEQVAAFLLYLEALSNSLPSRLIKTGVCELCSAADQELRPYGGNGEYICYDCGMANEAMTRRRYQQIHHKKGFDA